jgi:hypothetical protein
MMRWVYLGFVVFLALVWSTSCFFYSPYVQKRAGAGPDAVNDWSEKYSVLYGRYPTKSERDVYQGRLRDKVEQYIVAHPDLSPRRVSQLRALAIYPGMTKEEAKFFLNAAVKVIRDPQELATRAGNFWRDLQGRTRLGCMNRTYFSSGEGS